MKQTPFTALVGRSVPIHLAGMGGGSTPKLAAAVSNAGALGMVNRSGVGGGDIAKVFDDLAKRTTHPTSANFLMPFLDMSVVELAKKTMVASYRNPTGGATALSVPYEQSGVARTMYLDFMFFHEIDGEIINDVVDPHRTDSADTGPEWTGLAAYAVENGDTFRRVLAVIKSDDQRLSLDLKDPQVAEQIAGTTNETDIRSLFECLGRSY